MEMHAGFTYSFQLEILLFENTSDKNYFSFKPSKFHIIIQPFANFFITAHTLPLKGHYHHDQQGMESECCF